MLQRYEGPSTYHRPPPTSVHRENVNVQNTQIVRIPGTGMRVCVPSVYYVLFNINDVKPIDEKSKQPWSRNHHPSNPTPGKDAKREL